MQLRENDIAGRWSSNSLFLSCQKFRKISPLQSLSDSSKSLSNRPTFFNEYAGNYPSIGVCSTENSSGLDDLLTTAENCVYQAKQMGRNMVIELLDFLESIKAVVYMIINHAHSLQIGIADSSAKKFKSTRFHIFTNAV